MNGIKTSAWVLHEKGNGADEAALFRKGTVTIEPLAANEVLVEPIFGHWEGNMSHAISREPMDVCRKRREPRVVLGNSGVVRVLETGANVTKVKEGDICVFLTNSSSNRYGYLDKVFAFGFDEPGTVGMLAKQTKVTENHISPIPKDSTVPMHQWPIISVRYGTAWSNWKVTEKCWRAQVLEGGHPAPWVFGWGGGVALGELLLAKAQGFKAAMMASTDERLKVIKEMGITPVDRRRFADLNYDPEKYESDRDYRKKYFASLSTFRKIVDDVTEGEGVSIFIENIGLPVYPASLRVLARPGVISTSGWKHGMGLDVNRGLECHQRHIHVFTHAFHASEGAEAISFYDKNSWWTPKDNFPIYNWEDIPQLVDDYSNGRIDSYFPAFRVNPE